MADVIRILGLYDDNHAPMFRMETGEIYNSPRELIEFLSHSHDVEYQVKMFAIVDEWSCRLQVYSEEEVNDMFAFLEDVARTPENLTFEEIFELFWESTNSTWW